MPKSQVSAQEQLQLLLRHLRSEARLTQAEVAERVGQPQSFVSKYESGERRLDVLELRAVCSAMGTSLADFILNQRKQFWAYVRSISQTVGYTVRGAGPNPGAQH